MDAVPKFRRPPFLVKKGKQTTIYQRVLNYMNGIVKGLSPDHFIGKSHELRSSLTSTGGEHAQQIFCLCISRLFWPIPTLTLATHLQSLM